MLGVQGELALFGGKPAVNEGSVQPWPQVAADDRVAVMGVLERGVLWGARRRRRRHCRRNGRRTWARAIAW